MVDVAHADLTGSDLHEPKGIESATAGQVYISDGNGSGAWTDTGATIGSSSFTTGDLKPTFKTTADSGWVMCDDGTIGDVSSGATTRAAADTEDLYVLLWTNFANTEAAVSSGRGASAAADFAAHKTIALPKMLGRVYGIAGAGSGLTSRAMGKTVGAEDHTLTSAEMPSHIHGITQYVGTGQVGMSSSAQGNGPTIVANPLSGHNTSSTGSSGSHNNMQPTVFLKMMVKL